MAILVRLLNHQEVWKIGLPDIREELQGLSLLEGGCFRTKDFSLRRMAVFCIQCIAPDGFQDKNIDQIDQLQEVCQPRNQVVQDSYPR